MPRYVNNRDTRYKIKALPPDCNLKKKLARR